MPGRGRRRTARSARHILQSGSVDKRAGKNFKSRATILAGLRSYGTRRPCRAAFDPISAVCSVLMKPILTLCALFLSASMTFAADGDAPKKGPPEGGPRPPPEEIFKKLDTNGDGAVSKEEFLASPRAQKDPEKAGKRFDDLDKNKDGKLSLDEFKAGGDRRGRKGGPEGGPPPPGGPKGPPGEKPEGK